MSFCQEVISVVGPTASGKTSLALELAKQKLTQYPAGVKLISADSRQVYREFPVLAGTEEEKYRNLDARISVHGLGIIDIDDEWSLGNFLNFARPLLETAAAAKQLVIVVGGTLLYHQHLFAQNDQAEVPPNTNVRAAAEAMETAQLQAWLQQIAPEVAAALNQSDFHNPRRLVRQIEIALWQKIPNLPHKKPKVKLKIQIKHSFITPHYQKSQLPNKIRARVEERWQNGALQEVKKVLVTHLALAEDNATSTALISKLPLGFAEIRDFLQSKKSLEETLKLWALHEWQYARRQLKWPVLTEAQTL